MQIYSAERRGRVGAMGTPNSSQFLLRCSCSALFVLLVLLSASQIYALDHEINRENKRREEGGLGRRLLLSFKEIPRGTNVTFECSPSGPCIPCLYSEKNDEKYHCSETGYRIPLKCIKLEDGSKSPNRKKASNSRSALEISLDSARPHVLLHDSEQPGTSINHRSLLEDSATSEGSSQAYITYRSCIPAVNEEKLSVLGFEGILLCMLLVSASAVYIRRKRTVAMLGVGGGRIQTNSRF